MEKNPAASDVNPRGPQRESGEPVSSVRPIHSPPLLARVLVQRGCGSTEWRMPLRMRIIMAWRILRTGKI